MESRRNFLKVAATGAALLGAESKLGFARILDQQPGKSKVVVARDPSLHEAGAQLDEKRMLALLDRAITAYTGHAHPVEAWKSIVPASFISGGKVIGRFGRQGNFDSPCSGAGHRGAAAADRR
jgi:hypothetical protein